MFSHLQSFFQLLNKLLDLFSLFRVQLILNQTFPESEQLLLESIILAR
jgi:hypothetical protein